MIKYKKYRSIEWEPTCKQLNAYYGGKVEKKIKKKKRKRGPMIILGKTKQEWKQLELQYRREWIIFLVGFILGALIF